MAQRRATERREVRVADPTLSDEANRILTQELRQVLGRDAVELPAGRGHAERARHGGRPRLLVELAGNRLALGMIVLGGLVVGGAISLATGSWWFLLLPLTLLLAGVALVALATVQLTTETEHLSPGAAARLEDEGVADPDALFSELVEQFSDSPELRRRQSAYPRGMEIADASDRRP